MLRPFLAWLVMLAFAIMNGVFREAVLLAHLSRPNAYLISGVLLALIILGLAVALAPWLRLRSTAHALSVGLVWASLTIGFEFALGGLQGRSLPEMLEAYRFREGNVWPAVLAVTGLAPMLARLIRRIPGRPTRE